MSLKVVFYFRDTNQTPPSPLPQYQNWWDMGYLITSYSVSYYSIKWYIIHSENDAYSVGECCLSCLLLWYLLSG